MKYLLISLLPLFFLFQACQVPVEAQEQDEPSSTALDSSLLTAVVDTPPPVDPRPTPAQVDSILNGPDTAWVDIEDLSQTIVLDIRYATTNNFMELQVYDCPKCLMRLVTAKALLQAEAELQQQGLGFKMFDCYRPSSAQYKLWKKVPDRRYVAPPTKGSIHSRGGALDLTLIDLKTQEQLAMGTHYDYFGKEAYWSNQDLPQATLDNRQLLRSTLEKHGFKTVTTEWWHFNYRRAWFTLSNKQWACE
jgi:D-alanyl-D-alanine dipeptidase